MGCMAVIITAFLLSAGPIDDVDEAVARFRTQWAKARGGNRANDVDIKNRALTELSVYRDERILKIYLEKFAKERDDGVLEKCARGLAQYPASDAAAAALFARVKSLGRGRKSQSKGMIRALFESIASLDRKCIEKYVAYPLDFLNDRETELVISAVRCIAKMESPKAVKRLIQTMDKLQDPVRKAIRGGGLPDPLPGEEPYDCDGD